MLDDSLTERVTARAAETQETMQQYVERLLRDMMDYNLGFNGRIPYLRPEPGQPFTVLTVEEVNRRAWGDVE